jgi:23S rRNA (pseudouridine1915-N3)-methyltransferase
MDLLLLWVGKPRDKLLDELFERYLGRLQRYRKVRTAHVPEAGGKTRSSSETKRLEAARLRERLERDGIPAARWMVLDERGEHFDTKSLASSLREQADRGLKHLGLVIGGAEGLDEQFRNEAGRVWALSKLTFPHELARVLLAEQLYRAESLLAGHPYHRE